MTNVFISHSNSRYDMDFVRDLGEALTRRGYEVFVDIMDLPVGNTLGDSLNVTRSQISARTTISTKPFSIWWKQSTGSLLTTGKAIDELDRPVLKRAL